MKKLTVIWIGLLLVAVSISGCASTTGSTSGTKIKESIASTLKEVTDIDCLVGYQLGANLGQSTSLKDEVITTELKKYVTESDTYKKCYKLGLVANYLGSGDLIDVAKNLLSK